MVLLHRTGYLASAFVFLSPFHRHPSPPSWSTLSLFFPLFFVHKAIPRGNKSVSEGLLWKLTSLIESNEAWTQGGRQEKVSRLRTFNEYWIHDHHSLCFTHTHETADVSIRRNSPIGLKAIIISIEKCTYTIFPLGLDRSGYNRAKKKWNIYNSCCGAVESEIIDFFETVKRVAAVFVFCLVFSYTGLWSDSGAFIVAAKEPHISLRVGRDQNRAKKRVNIGLQMNANVALYLLNV